MKYAYVGCRTTKERNARGKGISVYQVDDTGKWELIQIVENLVNPSFLCLDKTGEFLYTIHGDKSEISSFSIDKATGKLFYINTVSTEGVNPVHLSIDKTNRWIFVANLQTGTVAVIPRAEDGSLEALKELYTIPGLTKDTISHPHQVQQDRTGEYLIVSCQGRKQGFGQVDVFKIDSENGTLDRTCVVRSREIAEPRHFVFHQNNKWGYGVNEKDFSVTSYYFDDTNGMLEAKQILPTLPETYTGDGWASGIDITDDGKYVIVSNRKHDSITSFQVQENGFLKYCDSMKTDGNQPRFITWDEDRKAVIAANELTDTIVEIQLNEETGKFRVPIKKVDSESPVCVIFSI
ncbi:MAG: lactonase family protein [Eubacteriales bacterium]|nr:lactonase family protein [Eubacteriales bacterium]